MEITAPTLMSSEGLDMSWLMSRPTSGPRTDSAAALSLPEVEHKAAACLQVDDEGPDVAGLSPVELVETGTKVHRWIEVEDPHRLPSYRVPGAWPLCVISGSSERHGDVREISHEVCSAACWSVLLSCRA